MALSYMQDPQFAAGFLASQSQTMKKDVPAEKHHHHHHLHHHQQTPSPPLNNNTASHNHNNPTASASASLLMNMATLGAFSSPAHLQMAALAAMQQLQNPAVAASLVPSLYTHPQLFPGWPPSASSPPSSLQPGPVSPALSTKSSHSHGSRKSQPQHLHHHNNNSHSHNNNNVVSSSSNADRLSDTKKVYTMKKRASAARLKESGRTHAGQTKIDNAAASPGRPAGSPETVKDPSRDKVFTCGVCNRSFGYKHVLQNHERTHTGEKPFECKECHKKFTRDHHLKTHMRLHTGEKPYSCHHCDRQFVQVANLRRHLRVHTGERPYACDVCDNKFSDSNQLKAHQLIHKDEKPWECDKCLQRFRRRHHWIHHKCSGQSHASSPAASNSSSAATLAASLLPVSALPKQQPQHQQPLGQQRTSSPLHGDEQLSMDDEDEDVEMARESAAGSPSPALTRAALPLNLSCTPLAELMQPVQTEPEDLSMSGARSRALSGSAGCSSPATSRCSGSEDDEESRLLPQHIKEESSSPYAR